MNNNTLGNNIKMFRKAFGETQQQLADAIFCERQAISQYETGKRKPNDEVLLLIAKRYGQPISSFFDTDWSGLNNIQIDTNFIYKYLDILLPTIVSDQALCDENFNKAFKLHTDAFKSIKDSSDNDDINILLWSLYYYIEALDNTEISAEVSINILSCAFFLLHFCKTIISFSDFQSFYSFFYKETEKIEENLPDLELYAKEIYDSVYEPDEINKIKNTAIDSTKWHDLGYYYLALEYLLRIVENNNNDTLNSYIGIEMLSAFATAGNKYARGLLDLFKK